MRRDRLRTLTAASLVVLTCAALASGCVNAKGPSEASETVESQPDVPQEKSTPAEMKRPPTTAEAPAGDGDTARSKAARFTQWALVHTFVRTPTVSSQVFSATEAMAVTKDHLVGVTTDAGEHWHFNKVPSGPIHAMAGRAGGPFVVVGAGGSMNISTDGRLWQELPRHSGDDLLGAVIHGDTLVAIGKKGTVVQVALNGSKGYAGPLPNAFKATALRHDGDRLIAFSGKKGYASSDGRVWKKLAALPDGLARGKTVTSRGICQLGKVGKRKGLVCEVSGTAYGLDGATIVVNKNSLAVSTDRGKHWHFTTLDFNRVHNVIGGQDGPYVAFGASGTLAVSTDGMTWKLKPLQTTRHLRDGLVDGQRLIIVGDGGTIVRSDDAGVSWDVAIDVIKGDLNRVTKQGATLHAVAGKQTFASSDGGHTWTESPGSTSVPPRLPPSPCGDDLPGAGERCQFSRKTTTPSGLPNARGFRFRGEVGLVTGDVGLVAFTADGGATWRTSHGFPLKRIQTFEVNGNVIVAMDHTSVVVSSDGGQTFREAQIPQYARGGLKDAHVTHSGTVYAGGKKGIILKSEGALEHWLPLNTGEMNRTEFVRLFEVGSNLYAAGKAGELFRSSNEGASWRQVPLGMKGQIVLMSGHGDAVMALMRGKRTGGALIRSHDGGQHFAIHRPLHGFLSTEVHPQTVFEYDGETLIWANKTSTDEGLTWTRHTDSHRPRHEVGDGLSASVVGDRMLLYSEGSDEYEAQVFLPTNGGRLACDPATSCWLLGDGHVYRSR